MIKKCILSSFTLLAQICNAQWSQQSFGYNFDFTDVAFRDSLNGIISTYYGPLVTHDAVSWVHLNSPVNLYDVACINDTIVYAVGVDDSNVAFKSYDSGDSWVPLLSFDHFGNTESFINKDTGVVGTGSWFVNAGGVAITTDGGNNWQTVELGPVHWIKMFSRDSIKIMQPGGLFPFAYFFETVDGDQNWQPLNNSSFPYDDDIFPWKRTYFFNWSHGLYLFDRGYETFDGGVTWNKSAEIDSTITFNTIGFATNQVGYIAGHDSQTNLKIYSTKNGGQTWFENTIDVNTTETIYAFDCIDENRCYAVGSNGLFLVTTNGGGVGMNEIDQSNFDFSIYPNPATSQLEISLPTNYKSHHLKILNPLGQTMKEESFYTNQLSFNISELPSGLYFIELQNEEVKAVKKFVKQ